MAAFACCAHFAALAFAPGCAPPVRLVANGAAAAARAHTVMGSAPKPTEVTIVMNGLPGAMGIEVAQACLRRGMRLAPVGLTGPSRQGETIDIEGPDGTNTVRLVPGPSSTSPDASAECEAVGAELERMRAAAGGKLVCIDYTHPLAVNANAAWYARHGLDFVMGTTGGDRAALEATVTKSPSLYAVIAPNMAKQIVALQVRLVPPPPCPAVIRDASAPHEGCCLTCDTSSSLPAGGPGAHGCRLPRRL